MANHDELSKINEALEDFVKVDVLDIEFQAFELHNGWTFDTLLQIQHKVNFPERTAQMPDKDHPSIKSAADRNVCLPP